MKYLNEIRTLEELKKNYHKWAIRLHPDNGGSLEEMKVLNEEYAQVFKKVKNIHLNKDGKEYTKETNEKPEEFRNLINELLKLNNILIEVIGCFVWVSGETRPYRDKLKSLGMKWHSKKKRWYFSPEGYKRYGGGEYSMEDIRNMYGVEFSEEVNKKEIQTAEAI